MKMRRIHDELERFRVEWHRGETLRVYEAFAFFCPACPLAKAGPPFVRSIQRWFATNFLRNITEAVEGGGNV
jgi:uncharacterized protein (UPF0548 family)